MCMRACVRACVHVCARTYWTAASIAEMRVSIREMAPSELFMFPAVLSRKPTSIASSLSRIRCRIGQWEQPSQTVDRVVSQEALPPQNSSVYAHAHAWYTRLCVVGGSYASTLAVRLQSMCLEMCLGMYLGMWALAYLQLRVAPFLHYAVLLCRYHIPVITCAITLTIRCKTIIILIEP